MWTDVLYHHGIKGQKWGVRNGPPYPLGSDKLAGSIFRNAKKHEPAITKDISEAVKLSGASLYGLEHKLKTRESIKRKIETDSTEKKISVSSAGEKIKDAVRYTSLTNDSNYVKTYNNVKRYLEGKGYKETRCRNYFNEYRFGKSSHKSVQSIFKTPYGYEFEVQFHTKSSQKAKDKKVPLYEEVRQPGISIIRRNEIISNMIALAEQVNDPEGVYSIKSHGK